MKGVYQHCAEKHLHRYLAEFNFRYNHRVARGCSDIDRTLAAKDFTNALPASSKEAHRIFHELLNDPNDRAAGITAAAYLESSLEETLTYKLGKIGSGPINELFRGDGPLGTFSAKIKFTASIALLGERTRNDFDCIREIRNAFAHSKLRADFETLEIQIVCWQISFPKWGTGQGAMQKEEAGATRVRFAATCTLYNEMLAEMATPGRHEFSKKILGL